MHVQNNYIDLFTDLLEALLQHSSTRCHSQLLVLIPVFKRLYKHRRHIFFGFQVSGSQSWNKDHLQMTPLLRAVQSKVSEGLIFSR